MKKTDDMKNINEENGTYLRRIKDSDMPPEWKGDGEEFCRIQYGHMWPRKVWNLRTQGILEELHVCYHFPRPGSVCQKHAKLSRMKSTQKCSNFLPIIRFHGNNSIWLNFTQFFLRHFSLGVNIHYHTCKFAVDSVHPLSLNLKIF